MKKIPKVAREIVEYIKQYDRTPKDLCTRLNVSTVTVQKYLKELCADGYIEKVGKRHMYTTNLYVNCRHQLSKVLVLIIILCS